MNMNEFPQSLLPGSYGRAIVLMDKKGVIMRQDSTGDFFKIRNGVVECGVISEKSENKIEWGKEVDMSDISMSQSTWSLILWIFNDEIDKEFKEECDSHIKNLHDCGYSNLDEPCFW